MSRPRYWYWISQMFVVHPSWLHFSTVKTRGFNFHFKNYLLNQWRPFSAIVPRWLKLFSYMLDFFILIMFLNIFEKWTDLWGYAEENVLIYICLQKWAIWHDVSKSSWLHFQVINVTVKFKFKIKWLFISSANELVRGLKLDRLTWPFFISLIFVSKCTWSDQKILLVIVSIFNILLIPY